MEDNICEEITIKINWRTDVYFDENEIWKCKITKFPLNGKYKDDDGTIRYFKNGKWHNENGPAYIEKNGYENYCINGNFHRIDGPAHIWPEGGGHAWYINDYNIDNEIIDVWLKENDIPLDWNIWTDSDKMLFALHWSDYKGLAKVLYL